MDLLGQVLFWKDLPGHSFTLSYPLKSQEPTIINRITQNFTQIPQPDCPPPPYPHFFLTDRRKLHKNVSSTQSSHKVAVVKKSDTHIYISPSSVTSTHSFSRTHTHTHSGLHIYTSITVLIPPASTLVYVHSRVRNLTHTHTPCAQSEKVARDYNKCYTDRHGLQSGVSF